MLSNVEQSKLILNRIIGSKFTAVCWTRQVRFSAKTKMSVSAVQPTVHSGGVSSGRVCNQRG